MQHAGPSPQPEREVAISIRGISKTFGGANGVRALDGVSAEVHEREFVSILGPSGCGKSTLLRIIAGLIPFEDGDLRVLGSQVDGPSTEVGMVFQTSNLLPWRTVEGNLRLGIDIGRRRSADSQERIAAMIRTLRLEGFGKRYPHELSGGMQQRVALGQALVRNPRLLLMDEPFGALDALTRDRLNVELLRVWQAERKTVVLVTHSIVEAVFLSDRVLVLSDRPGRILEDVAIELPRPRDPRATRQAPEFGDYVVRLSEHLDLL